ncbi:Chalcone-flavanone isomerase [Planctomycetes bacterium Pan216]|uniref:Chalcone-flavanone isomerase n=1 Tax=Kolteria novifilia TaxID=2527975 RepID=A0A518B882_9BACT|nr:Chalcone-flavanone isomerase [Planctomycetes bacterium Pan216]
MRTTALMLLGMTATIAMAQQRVPAPGSQVSFPAQVSLNIGDQPMPLDLTGTATRTKLVFNVYAMGSYVTKDSQVRSADELASINEPKALHLVLERNVAGSTMAQAVKRSIRANYPRGFDREVKQLVDFMTSRSVKQGDNVWIIHRPGIGLEISMGKSGRTLIPNEKFSKTIWDIYLGPKNMGAHIKSGLTSRL